MQNKRIKVRKAITKLQFLDIMECDEDNDQINEIQNKYYFLQNELSKIFVQEAYSRRELENIMHILKELVSLLRNYPKDIFDIFKKDNLILKVIDLFCGTAEISLIEYCLIVLSDFSYYYFDLNMFCDFGLLEKIVGSITSPVPRIEKISKVLILNLITYKKIFNMKNLYEWVEIFQTFYEDYYSQTRFLYIISQYNHPEKELIYLIEYLTTIILSNKNDFYLHEYCIPALYFFINQTISDSVRFEISKYISKEILEIMLNFIDDENISSKIFSIIEILYEFNQNIIEVMDETLFLRLLTVLQCHSNYKLKVPILNFLRFMVDNSLFSINEEFQIEIHKILSEGNYKEKKYCVFLIKSMIQQSQLKYISNFYSDLMIFLFDSSVEITIELLSIINDLLYHEETFRNFLFQNHELLEQLQIIIHDEKIKNFDDCESLIHSIDQTISCFLF